jgi:hypothetical protein
MATETSARDSFLSGGHSLGAVCALALLPVVGIFWWGALPSRRSSPSFGLFWTYAVDRRFGDSDLPQARACTPPAYA